MADFTPGPWVVGTAVNGNWIEMADGKSVARTFYEHVGAEQEDANAHLIAASPDMYDALEALAQAASGYPMSGVEFEERRIAAFAALAKARGQ